MVKHITPRPVVLGFAPALPSLRLGVVDWCWPSRAFADIEGVERPPDILPRSRSLVPDLRLPTPMPRDAIVKRSVTLTGHRTSLSLEQPFWEGVKRLAAARGLSVNALVAQVDRSRLTADGLPPNLSSALRLLVLRAALSGELEGEF